VGGRLSRWRRLHLALVRRLSGVRADPGGEDAAPTRRGPLIVGYYVWQYPYPSETFIRREVRALQQAGVPVMVFADAPGELGALDEGDRALTQSTHYLPSLSRLALSGWALAFLLRRPARVLRLMVFVFATRYAREKSVASDLEMVARGVRLAVQLRSRGVTHLHSPWASSSAFVALVASRLVQVPFSVQGRAHDLHRGDSAFALVEKFTHARFVVTNTRYNLEGIRGLLPASQHAKVHLVYNGVDVAEYHPVARRARSAEAPLRMLCVARLIEPKGLTILLRTCGVLRERGIDVTCEVIGGPEEPLYTGYLTQLKVLHRQLRLGEMVRFAGAQPSSVVREAYARSDVFVLPCVVAANGSKDITPNALIEAMAMGLPVISTRMTGIPEIVTDGVSGVLVPPGDVDALADAIMRLKADPALCASLGARARQAVEERFDIHRNVEQRAQLFGARS